MVVGANFRLSAVVTVRRKVMKCSKETTNTIRKLMMCRFQKCSFYQNRSMAFFKNSTFVFDTISFSLAVWLSPLLTRRPAFSSPTE